MKIVLDEGEIRMRTGNRLPGKVTRRRAVTQKRRGLVSAVLGLLCIALTSAQAIELHEKPDWLVGKLLISTMGSEKVLPSDKKPLDQMICCLDLDDGSCTAVKVPGNANLVKNMLDGRPMIIYPQNACYGLAEDAYELQNWRTIGFEYVNVEDSRITISSTNSCIFTGRYAIAVLSLGRSIRTVPDFFGKSYIYSRVYLSYGIDNTSELAIQLVNEIGGWEAYQSEYKVLKSYDAGHPVGGMSFSFTENKCAIRDIDGSVTSIDMRDASSVICSEKADGAICWLGDKVVYCKNVSDGVELGKESIRQLRIWDPKTGRVSSLAELWNSNELYLSVQQTPLYMSVNSDSTILAIYLGGSFERDYLLERGGRIIFVSLKNGESCECIPWDSISDSSKKGKVYFYGFGYTDNGYVIYDPYTMLDTRLAWY